MRAICLRIVPFLLCALSYQSSVYGEGPSTRMIVGGEEVDPAFKYPFMTALLRSSGSLFCGGSLVNESWVLTAARASSDWMT